MKIEKNLIKAFLIAPVSFGLLLLVFTMFTNNVGEGLWGLQFVAFVAYPMTVVLGIPTYIILRKFKLNGLVTYLLSGLALSIAPIMFFVVSPRLHEIQNNRATEIFMESQYGISFIIAFACVFSTLVFWLIARPDRLEYKK